MVVEVCTPTTTNADERVIFEVALHEDNHMKLEILIIDYLAVLISDLRNAPESLEQPSIPTSWGPIVLETFA